MLSAKRIAGFFFGFTVIFALLMAPWPGLDEAHAGLLRVAGNVLFARFGSDGVVQFRSLSAPAPGHELEVALSNLRSGVAYVFPFSSRKQGYKPTAFVLALTLATPIPWSRRWRTVLWGLLWVNVYVLLRVTVFLFAAFSGDAQLAPFSLGAIGTKVLVYVHWVVVASFAGSLILPLVIWVLVTFRRKDWEAVLQRTATKPKAPGMTGK